MIRDIAIYDRSFHEQAAWHGNLAGLVEDELKDALGPWHEVEDDAGKMIGSYFDKYVREPVAPKRTLTDAADRDASGKPATPDLSGLSNDALVKELRRRGCMACVFEPSDVAPRISRHPGVRFADLSPEADPEAMARAQDWLFDNEDKIEEALTSYGNAEVDSLLEDQDEIPELPKIADEVHASGVSGMTTTIAELCENQPHLADGIYRVVSDCDQVSLIERVGEVWQLAERRLPEWAPPRVGELVRFDQAPDAHIVIEQVPSLQVYYVDDVYTIVDQYGETHHVEADDDSWVVLADTRHLD